MIIDANMHWLPEDLFTNENLRDSFISCVPCSYGEYAGVTEMPGTKMQQIIIEKPKGYINLNYGEKQYDSNTQVKDMDEAGVDKAILRIPCWQEWLPLEICKMVNDRIYKHINKHPGRFIALAVVPPWGTKECLKEVERCIKDLGFSGVQMAAHYGKLYLDEPQFKPYFKELNRLDVPVVVHHTPLPVDYESIIKYNNLRRQYGRCVDQATAVGRELFSGMFEEFPNLKLSHSMLGGGFFAFAHMLAPRTEGVKETLERFDVAGDVRKYLDKNIYFDTSGAPQWGKAQLECAVSALGADHILYGSSYPLRREWFGKSGIDFVKGLNISEKDKALILGRNAARLFKIK